MRSAAGTFGKPGMVMIEPVRATTKPAPALTFTSRTVTVEPSGAPRTVWSSVKDYWVLSMQIGSLP